MTVLPPARDPRTLTAETGTSYPPPHDAPVRKRRKRRLSPALGLNDFGVNLVELPPGAWSSQRHWHSREDEFVMVLEGTLTLITDAGEQDLGPGMVAGFPKGVADGHHLVNRSDAPAVYLEVGSRDAADEADYPDIDMVLRPGAGFLHRDGEPY